ncbi:hypothetical protein SynMINOS11_01222 [Synechococcus sp. Minos11]|jgi:hypothetical protein|uniref:hypothetical protein n=1 Tax=Synechococcus sp. Minos11 TaxID=221341 RepID=UPI0001525FE7|nr:hypothetical protein [Synechococcus sp. Minos11]MEC8605067.1 hypothetical protein [Cyanobacteriota bacterium]MEC8608489.1 hypothetical protein [Cyanobacteriota bacterium]QNJ08685.1 hypothetical protein SynMINOS11_01222 [Synechococcus sp. Minos11]CAK28021.1 Uncharacterized membrane protein [Synechococcus sp. RCC307]|tara:strand:+ start:1289 stop:1459 length:171 start_codon:yes stop_codon:yes gene_type:complete
MGSRPWLVLMVLMAVAIGTQLVRENRMLKHRLLLQQQFIKALPQRECPKVPSGKLI